MTLSTQISFEEAPDNEDNLSPRHPHLRPATGILVQIPKPNGGVIEVLDDTGEFNHFYTKPTLPVQMGYTMFQIASAYQFSDAKVFGSEGFYRLNPGTMLAEDMENRPVPSINASTHTLPNHRNFEFVKPVTAIENPNIVGKVLQILRSEVDPLKVVLPTTVEGETALSLAAAFHHGNEVLDLLTIASANVALRKVNPNANLQYSMPFHKIGPNQTRVGVAEQNMVERFEQAEGDLRETRYRMNVADEAEKAIRWRLQFQNIPNREATSLARVSMALLPIWNVALVSEVRGLQSFWRGDLHVNILSSRQVLSEQMSLGLAARLDEDKNYSQLEQLATLREDVGLVYIGAQKRRTTSLVL